MTAGGGANDELVDAGGEMLVLVPSRSCRASIGWLRPPNRDMYADEVEVKEEALGAEKGDDVSEEGDRLAEPG